MKKRLCFSRGYRSAQDSVPVFLIDFKILGFQVIDSMLL
jgi:hypothetical protein